MRAEGLTAALLLAVAAGWPVTGLAAECDAQPPLVFPTYRSFALRSTHSSIAVALAAEDFDDDGFVDIAAACGAPGEISILPGAGGRSFAAPVHIPMDFRVGYELAAADFDGDGDPDLAALNYSPEPEYREVLMLRNEGGFAFSITGTYRIPDHGWQFVVADADLDGALDLLVPVWDTSDVMLLRGDGAGRFADGLRIGVEPIGRLRRIAAGDLDGDGWPDLVVTGATERWLVGVMRSLGAGGFAPPVLYDAGRRPASVEIADLDLDGLRTSPPARSTRRAWACCSTTARGASRSCGFSTAVTALSPSVWGTSTGTAGSTSTAPAEPSA
ncbi:MAG: VCBS repeat-containing protein [Planctomycetes bacterium]|nr:VCBS repeat-containing protein [Planctomycetota bacterium]